MHLDPQSCGLHGFVRSLDSQLSLKLIVWAIDSDSDQNEIQHNVLLLIMIVD